MGSVLQHIYFYLHIFISDRWVHTFNLWSMLIETLILQSNVSMLVNKTSLSFAKYLKKMALNGGIVPPFHGLQDGVGTGPESTEQRGRLFAHYGIIAISTRLCKHTWCVGETRQPHQRPEAVFLFIHVWPAIFIYVMRPTYILYLHKILYKKIVLGYSTK